jgi:hypothetical protein
MMLVGAGVRLSCVWAQRARHAVSLRAACEVERRRAGKLEAFRLVTRKGELPSLN